MQAGPPGKWLKVFARTNTEVDFGSGVANPWSRDRWVGALKGGPVKSPFLWYAKVDST